MDSAEQIFENFVKGGYAHLCQVRDEQRIETELIDYKTVKDDRSPMSQDDIRNLSKALSGFANSGGGVIVWGVYCRRTGGSDDADCVKRLQPISGIKRFLSDLNSRSPEIVDGAVIGARHEALEEPPGSDTGFAFSYIPKGEGLPHQAQDKAFYYRSGSTFQKMSTWMVADRMRRSESPKLELRWVPVTSSSYDCLAGFKQRINLEVVNSGNVAAKHVSMILNATNNPFRDSFGLPEYPNFHQWETWKGVLKIGAKPDLIVFPGFGIPIASFVIDTADDDIVTTFSYRLQCDGFRGTGELSISPSAVIDAVEFEEVVSSSW